MKMHPNITVEQLQTNLKSGEVIHLIDVRSAGEFASGHVPQAANIPLEQVESRLQDFPSGKVAILCQSGSRAGMACDILKHHHENVFVVEGGTAAWISAGYPVIKTTSSTWSLERQVRFLAGFLALTGAVLAVTVNPLWAYLSMFIGAGLTFAGLTNICGMALLLAKLPWNKPSTCASRPMEVKR